MWMMRKTFVCRRTLWTVLASFTFELWSEWWPGCSGAEVQGSKAPTPGRCRVPAPLRWDEPAHMKWTRTAFKDPSQHYSACIYNNDHVLSGWVVIWGDKYRQFDCLRLQMDLPQTVLVSSCWSCPTLWRCRATVFYISECSCVFYLFYISIMIAITGVD